MRRTRFLALLTLAIGVGACAADAPTAPAANLRSGASYRAVALGTLGGSFSTATAVNAAREVVGTSTTAAGDYHAFLWRRGLMIDLGTLGGATSSAAGIGPAGEVVGTSATAAGASRAFVWRNGVMRALPTLGGDYGEANGIAENGTVVGSSTTANGATHAVVWQGGRITDLGPISRFAQGFAVSPRGQVVGWFLPPTTDYRPFLWYRGVITNLGSLGGSLASANGINSRGQVVGWSDLPGPTVPTHAFLWQHGRMQDLGTLGGDKSEARAINDAGMVVGHSLTGLGDLHAVIWSDDRIIDLHPGGWYVQSDAHGVNAAGDVVGGSYGVESSEGGVAILWIPR